MSSSGKLPIAVCVILLLCCLSKAQNINMKNLETQVTESLKANVHKRLIINNVTGPNVYKVGWTAATAGEQFPYSIILHNATRIVFDKINARGGLLIAGVRYMVEMIVYDDGSSCETVGILYQRLIQVDQVNLLFSMVTNNCMTAAQAAEVAGIPFINAGNYYQPISGLTFQWSFNLIPNPISLGGACLDALYASGARTAVVAYDLDTGYLSLPITQLIIQQLNITVLSTDILNSANLISNPPSVDPTIIKWKGLNPNIFVGGATLQSNSYFFDRIRTDQWVPKGIYTWVSPHLGYINPIPWEYVGTVYVDSWDNSFTFSDPVFGDCAGYSAAYLATYQTPATGYTATITSSAIAAVLALENATDTSPAAFKKALLGLQTSTLYGPISFEGNALNRSGLCFQIVDSNSTVKVVYPSSFPGSVKLVYPWPFVYDPGFLYALDKSLAPDYSLRNGLIIGGCILVFLVIVGAVIALIVKYRYHLIIIPKQEDNEEWAS